MADDWIIEHHRDFYQQGYKIKKRLFSGKSEFQKVEVYDTESFGRMLLNDDLVMVSERDEFIYHEMIAHVPLFVHPNPRSVLVIGGGDGGTLREVLRHSDVEKCVMVEIDKMVVDACREHIPVTACMLDDARADLKIDDGVKFVRETDQKFDVVLVDSTDPIGPAKPLFGTDFYRDIYRILNDDGIVVSQGESPFYEVDAQTGLVKTISGVFPKLYMYAFSNLTYPGGLWNFTFASKGLSPIDDFSPVRVDEANLKMQYYNKHLHTACFQLPTFIYNRYKEYLTGFHN